jgi:hypothetical protein
MADQKLTALTEATSLDPTDLLYVVTDVAGTPTSKKVQAANLPGGVTLPVVNIVGSWTVEPALEAAHPQTMAFRGEIYTANGAWVGTPDFQQINVAGLTELEFQNVVGFSQTFQGFSNQAALDVLDLSSLEICLGTLNLGFSTATTVDISSLRFVLGDMDCDSYAPTVFDAPLLEVITATGFSPVGLRVSNSSTTTTINIPAIKYIGNKEWSFSDNSALTSVDVGSSLEYVGGDVNLTGNALDQTSVDGILVALAALDGTGGTTSYDNHTVNLSGGTNASPSGTGLTAKTTLEGRGNTVTVN